MDSEFAHNLSAFIEVHGETAIDLTLLKDFYRYNLASGDFDKLPAVYKPKLICMFDKMAYGRKVS
ncbi:hypothetical protein GCM10010840_11780 [Deinococcus aerolatus]|uniref:Uncharacterized protein n=1 Tax=Deinococcus aerolatus TaxID=522487 RepID=A0ABQ2G4M0_9DEIO|nr:hypothetical protein GCM10010840_11780 [Deinococcus aerolatus]